MSLCEGGSLRKNVSIWMQLNTMLSLNPKPTTSTNGWTY
jgi:hypothetical protein